MDLIDQVNLDWYCMIVKFNILKIDIGCGLFNMSG